MSLFKIAWRSIEQRSLASTLTALSMALGVALVVAVLIIFSTVNDTFNRSAEGFDLIVGAKGGKLQLVLNTVYHLSTPIENVPWSYYKEFKPGGRYASQVDVAIPYCLGDNYQGFRVVGTTPQLFDIDYRRGKSYRFADGRNFEDDHFFEAVIGSVVAHETGLKVGDTFEPTHGVTEEGKHHHDPFEIVGILDPTGTPNDKALFVNLEGFLLLEGHAKPVAAQPAGAKHDHDHEHEKDMAGEKDAGHQHDEKPVDKHEHDDHTHGHDHAHGHDHGHGHEHHDPLPEEQREVTAILVRTSGFANMTLPNEINEDSVAQAVYPQREIYNFMDGVVGPIQQILLLLAGLIVLVAGIGIMVSIYNSMSERRHDIAVMRSLGASRRTVLAIILLESILLSVGGGVLGFILGHGLPAALNPVITARTGVSLGAFEFATIGKLLGPQIMGSLPTFVGRIPCELVLLPLLVVLASIVGYLPAMTAYRTDVAKALTASP